MDKSKVTGSENQMAAKLYIISLKLSVFCQDHVDLFFSLGAIVKFP